MKYIFLFFIFLLFISFSFAQELKYDIREDYEAINISTDTIKAHKSYFSNLGKEYFFVGGMEYYHLEDKEDLKYFEENGYINNDSLFMFKNGKVLLIKNSFVKGNSVSCKYIDKNMVSFIYSYIDSGISKFSKNRLIGKNNNTCYQHSDKFFFPKDSISKRDIGFLDYNKSKINERLDYIKDKTKSDDKIVKLKNLYEYVMQKTNYNYEALEKGFSDENNEAWSLYYFLNGGNVVCDGYVKALVFLANNFNINAKRVVGDSQPIDNQEVVLEGYGHSWVKIGNNYFDPTFDDNENGYSLDYFNKSKRCFNLNHYTTGWKKFNTKNERYYYIENNFSYLTNNCLGILNNVILNDGKIKNFIKDLFKKQEVSIVKNYLCEYLTICDLKSSSKNNLKQELKKYIIKVGDEKYNFSKILDNTDKIYNTQEKSFAISKDKKNQVEIIVNKLFSILNNYNYEKRLNKFNYIKSKVDKYIKSDSVSENKKEILKYFQSIFVIEKIR